MKILAVCFLLLLIPAQLHAWEGRITHVIDGDSLVIEGVEVRLYGIDAPEHDQPGGEEATAWLTDLALGKQASVHHMDRDRYKRQVAVVYVGDMCIQVEELRAGHAWVYDAYCKTRECLGWRRIQEQAREERAGLWAENKPMPPWKWRRKVDN